MVNSGGRDMLEIVFTVTLPLNQITCAPIAFCQFSVDGYEKFAPTFGNLGELVPQGIGGPVKINAHPLAKLWFIPAFFDIWIQNVWIQSGRF